MPGLRPASSSCRRNTSSRPLRCSPNSSSSAAASAIASYRAALVRCLIERGIGVEMMDTPAACRTYNVLASEGRVVLAALLLDPDAPRDS